jgi:leader peptidase (prepilin peptidase)/N-methyltransferase
MPALLLAAALILGLVIGSFLNVLILRLPVMLERRWRAECAEHSVAASTGTAPSAADAAPAPPERLNLLSPASHCPTCRAPIRAWQNIPLLSYLALRGRCASCRAPIGARYPAVETLSGVLTAAVVWKFGFGAAGACAVLITWFLIALTVIDLDHQLLPDALTLPLLWLGLLASTAGWAGAHQSVPVAPVDSIVGAALGYLALWTVYHAFRLLTGKEGMGYGDFKLLAALGAWLGWRMLLPIVLLAALAGALVGIGLIVSRRHQRGTPLPFGPFLAAAGWIAMMWGREIVERYLALYGAPVG